MTGSRAGRDRTAAAPNPAAPDRAGAPRPGWLTSLATGALAVLVAVQLLASFGLLLWIATVPPKLDLETGPRPPSVGLQIGTTPAVAGVIAPSPRATALGIPKLGLRGDLLELGVDAAGALRPPTTPDVAGWFSGAAAPGEQGPTVIAGHVDSRSGPGVFYDLKDLALGDLIDVGRSDGRTATYRVTDVLTVDKDAFPTRLVYGPTAGAELRLITCGGSFDRASGHYLRNVVVSAVLVDRR